MRDGFATGEGTRRYGQRFAASDAAGNYRSSGAAADSVLLSSLGVGTYLGEIDEQADQAYRESIMVAIRGGMNVIDSAINYRHQRSERCVGQALRTLLDNREVQRDEVVVCTKAGYLSFDESVPADPKSYFLHEYVDPGILDPRDVVAGAHCMSPRFLKDQIDRSRRNLGLSCIDVFYVHNPETQLAEIPRERFEARLRAAFEFLEQQVSQGHIRYYGVASWNAFRVSPDDPSHMSLEGCVESARSVSRSHHFRFVQLPFNLAMTEAFAAKHQYVEGEWTSTLDAAQRLSLTVIGSSSLLRGRLTRDLPARLRQAIGCPTDAQAALQFARSAPGLSTALVGLGRPEHVTETLQVASSPSMGIEDWQALFRS